MSFGGAEQIQNIFIEMTHAMSLENARDHIKGIDDPLLMANTLMQRDTDLTIAVAAMNERGINAVVASSCEVHGYLTITDPDSGLSEDGGVIELYGPVMRIPIVGNEFTNIFWTRPVKSDTDAATNLAQLLTSKE